MIPHPGTGAHGHHSNSNREGLPRAAASGRDGTQLLRLIVHQSGAQTTTVTITERHDVPVLHVRAGGVFVYASTPEVVAAHLAAWRDTELAAGPVLPAAGTAAPMTTTATDRAELSVIVRQDTTPAVAVTRYPMDRTRPGRPACVETTTGPLTIRSYDRQSVADVLGVWMQAAALGAIVWASPALADL